MRDGAGNITDGVPFAGNVVPQSHVAAAQRQHAEDLHRNPRLRKSSGRPESGLCRATSITIPAAC